MDEVLYTKEFRALCGGEMKGCDRPWDKYLAKFGQINTA
jgi:hypothetical protein